MTLVLETTPSGDNRCCAATSIRRTLEVLRILPRKPDRSPSEERQIERAVEPIVAAAETTSGGFPARWKLPEKERGTFLYLAYGSNLCHEVFQGRRGIKPLASANVVVPTLRMTFDLPGIPYSEPCFANTARRDPSTPPEESPRSEKSPLLGPTDYHKNRWKKGLVGVVYEVTKEDYAHIIGTEGGGSAYQDIFVDCYAIASDEEVPMHPKTEAFIAHTLFAPEANPPGVNADGGEGRFRRPDPSYAQASARYLKYFIDGANEHEFPEEYKEYLRGLRPYSITTKKQRMGQIFLMSVWVPLILAIFGLQTLFQDKHGRNPAWLSKLQGMTFLALWTSYDRAFKSLFGDGERTIAGDDEDQASLKAQRQQRDGGNRSEVHIKVDCV